MQHREALLREMQSARLPLDETVAALVTADRLNVDLGDGWRVRDVIAHIALWERIADKKLSGAELPYGSDLAAKQPWNLNTFNEGMRERLRTLPDEELLAEYQAAYAALRETVANADEDACAPGGRAYQAIGEDSGGHYPAHLPALRAALETQR